MSWQKPWVVLVPGDVAWVERRTREILEREEDGSENYFRIIPGRGRYHVIAEKGNGGIESDMLLGDVFSRECEEPVYVIQSWREISSVFRFLKGTDAWVDQEAEDLARALECELPWSEKSPLELPKKKRQTVLLIQRLSKTKVLKALAKELGQPLQAEDYRLEEVPQGLLLTDGARDMGFATSCLAERFPLATIYAVMASSSLDFLLVSVMRNRKVEQFEQPPSEFPILPVLDEVMGEREPERILATLGIPREWFQL